MDIKKSLSISAMIKSNKRFVIEHILCFEIKKTEDRLGKKDEGGRTAKFNFA